jgi:hypothetical protein
MNMDVAPYLYSVIDDSITLIISVIDLYSVIDDLHNIYSRYVICEILLITLVIRRLSTAMLFINYND